MQKAAAVLEAQGQYLVAGCYYHALSELQRDGHMSAPGSLDHTAMVTNLVEAQRLFELADAVPEQQKAANEREMSVIDVTATRVFIWGIEESAELRMRLRSRRKELRNRVLVLPTTPREAMVK